MKKIIGFILLLLFSVTIASCSNTNTNTNNEDGRYSIYLLAKEKGYTGTYEEWIESLRGDKVVLVVEGNELKWKYSEEDDTKYRTLITLSFIKGKDGVDGVTPYIGDDGYWYIGDECLDVYAQPKEVKEITTSTVDGKTVFNFIFDDNTEIKAELKPEKNPIREVKSTLKEVNAYKSFKAFSEAKYYGIYLDKEEYQLGTVNLRFVDDESLVPYISLEEMSKLLNKNLNSTDVLSKVDEVDGNCIWTNTKAGTVESSVVINPHNQEITITGSFNKIYKNAVDNSKYSLLLESNYTETIIKNDDVKNAVLSYKDTDFQAFKEGGIYYYPFSLLSLALQSFTGHNYFYNYTNIYEFNEYENLKNVDIYKKETDEESYNVLEEMSKYVETNYTLTDPAGCPLMPMYYRLHNRSEFTFVFDNFYGLASVRNISSMKEFYKVYGIYDAMISDNAKIRGKAYSMASFILQDGHTGKANLGANSWGEENGGRGIDPAYVSKIDEERRTLRLSLKDQRTSVLTKAGFTADNSRNAILYSADGLTAYFYFDEFEATNNAYDNSGNRKPDEALQAVDSYFFFVKQLNEIKAHTTTVDGKEVKVKNVIIDDSLNGGGIIYAMGKLLALLSKDNNGVLYTQNELTNEITKCVYRVDSNKDGVFDEKDSFGNDFNFVILTSYISFSCGNAFPFVASKFDHVKTIGTKSGGGECVVGELVLSNAMQYYHSSAEHLIIYDETKKTIAGVEDGKDVDKTIFYHNLYNIEELNKIIKTLFTQA